MLPRMWRGVSRWLFGSVAVGALIALAGCSHYWFGEREAWRRDAEVACLNSGAVREGPQRVRVSAIDGPGICGADYPLRVTVFGDGAPLGYDDEPLRPPGAIPDGTLPQHWPLNEPPPYMQHSADPPPPQPGSPLSLTPAGVSTDDMPAPDAPPSARRTGLLPPDLPHPYPTAARSAPNDLPEPYSPADPRAEAATPATNYPPPLGLPPALLPASPRPLAGEGGVEVRSVGPVEVRPAATLACPIVSALDQWIGKAVQPAALHWFRQPVVEIKQISAYSCRGMNGNPNAHISEHAFGNALDIAEFTLADGHRISVQYGWRGTPEEQGFLHDVQLAACEEFTTVLAPGANIYHYNHIHLDLMRRAGGRRVCEPAAIPGEVVAERARARYAARHYGDPGVTGSIKPQRRLLGYSGEDDDRLPLAVPGED